MSQFDFQKFWKKYNKIILGFLFFLFIINYCNQQSVTRREAPVEQQEVAPGGEVVEDGQQLKSSEELLKERQAQQQEGPGSFFTMLILLSLGFAIVWMLRQGWWQAWWQKMFPGRVHFKVSKGVDSVTGRQLLKISINNRTKEGLTFMPPMIVFRKWGKERQFKLRGSNQDEMFPLTLTPGTGHRVVLDLDQFFEKIPDLKNTNRVGATIETTEGKRYLDFALPRWLDVLVN